MTFLSLKQLSAIVFILTVHFRAWDKVIIEYYDRISMNKKKPYSTKIKLLKH